MGSNNGDDGSRCSDKLLHAPMTGNGVTAPSAPRRRRRLDVSLEQDPSREEQAPHAPTPLPVRRRTPAPGARSGETSSCWDTRTAADAYIEQYFTSTPIDSIKAYNAHGDHRNNFHNPTQQVLWSRPTASTSRRATARRGVSASRHFCEAVRDYGMEELTRASDPRWTFPRRAPVVFAVRNTTRAGRRRCRGTWFHSDTGEDHARVRPRVWAFRARCTTSPSSPRYQRRV